MKTVIIIAFILAGCEGAPGRANGTIGARKAALVAQCVNQGGDPSVGADEVVCIVTNGIRWRIKL